MRIYAGILLTIVFTIWVLYRLFIKKDLKQNLTALYVYSTFIFIWGVIYLLCYIN